MKKHYLIVSARIIDEQKINDYKKVAVPVMEKFGGTMPPEKFNVTSVLAGQLNPQFLLRIEFPDQKSITDAFNSDEYKRVVSTRDEGYSNVSIVAIEEES